MSNAMTRHSNALTLKCEVLREVGHWKQSCRKCITEIQRGTVLLREARAAVKRQIHSARARLENRLKELELLAEKNLDSLVGAEEKLLQDYSKSVYSEQKRLEETEEALKENLVGTKLQRTIEDGKKSTALTKKTLLQIWKHSFRARVEFRPNSELSLVLCSIKSLGQVKFISEDSEGNNMVNLEYTSALNCAEESTTTSEKCTEMSLIQNICKESVQTKEKMIHNPYEDKGRFDQSEQQKRLVSFIDSDKITASPTKYWGACILQENMSVRKGNFMPKNKIPTGKLDMARPQSASLDGQRTVGRHKNLQTRLSKSAREENRLDSELITSNPKFLLNTTFSPFEEQGPEKMMRDFETYHTPKQQIVRYDDFDYIKEITALSEHADLPESTQEFKGSNNTFRILSPNSQCSTNISISMVSYKPPHSLASGPFYIKERGKSASYFTYFARFHTKKHPDATDLCRLLGITALESGHVVVTDISHLKVMLFDQGFRYLDSIECPSPCGITTVDENTIAVTLFHNHSILLIKVHSIHLERFKEFHIDCPESLYDVVYRHDSYYIMCRLGDVHVLDSGGKQTKVIHLQNLRQQAQQLEVDDGYKRLFISSHENLVCYDFEGTILWQFNKHPNQKHFTPAGLVLCNDRLFVTDWCAHKLIELSLDGTHVRDVITNNLEYPYAIAIQQNSGRVLLTQNNLFKQEARGRSIKVFQVK